MYDYISGSIAEITPTYAVIDVHGVGYMINISLTTYNALQNQQAAKLWVTESIREDAHLLFGFASKRERELFGLLNSVSGVGPNTARMILSSLPPEQLESTIAESNVAMLKAVKGIGSKTAQRIIVDLKDKIKLPSNAFIGNSGEASAHVWDEALAALVMLGFTQQASQKALKQLMAKHPGISVEDAIKQALKMM